MAQSLIPWNDGEGYIVASYEGNGNGSLRFSSSVPNEGLDRQQSVQVASVTHPLSVDVIVCQSGLREEFCTADSSQIFESSDGLTFAVLK